MMNLERFAVTLVHHMNQGRPLDWPTLGDLMFDCGMVVERKATPEEVSRIPRPEGAGDAPLEVSIRETSRDMNALLMKYPAAKQKPLEELSGRLDPVCDISGQEVEV